MSKYCATEGHILYKTLIRDAMRQAGFSLKKEDPTAVLVWWDDLRKKDFYGQLKPWQIVNRFPMINVICRKAPFVRLCQRTAQTFPSQFKFLPKSFLVPIQQEQFNAEVHKNEKRFIVKPDRGSLGEGITFVEIGDEPPAIERLCVAQEYIPSLLIDGYKFDFRIYALVASVNPLRVYVYRNGVARFCSKKATENSVFSELTNKSLNKKNPDVIMTQIVKMIADIMTSLEQQGHNTQHLWQKIDRAIVSAVITASKFLQQGMNKQCPKIGYQRCFQILGIDVLIDNDFNPYILECNYRPSLETNTPYERKMKMAMLSDAMQIMAPSQELQEYVTKNYSEHLAEDWPELMKTDPELIDAINKTVNKPPHSLGGFNLAYPCDNEAQMKKWDRMITFVGKMPTELKTRYFLPPALKKPAARTTTVPAPAAPIVEATHDDRIDGLSSGSDLKDDPNEGAEVDNGFVPVIDDEGGEDVAPELSALFINQIIQEKGHIPRKARRAAEQGLPLTTSDIVGGPVEGIRRVGRPVVRRSTHDDDNDM